MTTPVREKAECTYGIGQRISHFFALLFYACATVCAVAIGWWINELGAQSPIIGSLAASIVFFVGAGIVLNVIARANLPNLRFDREDDEPPGA